jgi:uncharacterized phage protein (TIGR01671 family)
MRDIKFRAWDKKEKKMVFWKGLFWDEEYDCACFEGEMTKDRTHYELMQYTGLKDEKGKEIYEGDIVKYLFSDDYAGEEFLEIKRPIEFREGMFYPICMRDSSFHDFDDKPLVWKDFEVIGNIYENPELLKEV